MPIDMTVFSADNLHDMAAATNTIVEVGANPEGSGVTYWCNIKRYVPDPDHAGTYENTYGEDDGSLDAAWGSAWIKFIRDQRKRVESSAAETSDAARLLDALGVQ